MTTPDFEALALKAWNEYHRLLDERRKQPPYPSFSAAVVAVVHEAYVNGKRETEQK